ncbi:MAG: hypothetical protein H6983_09700 [Ectothiorhodospiraceae bacterium]|nr:hypothetical protein [Chromatiales bacterium]MCP5154427.1 hypothetical protein [Ectothiorhodospiraceae bacterium]
MQIDFHHAVTYVVARLAGFGHAEAEVVAHSAQYVDDATNGGEILFDNGALYSRIASAHKMLDYRNFERLATARVWIPFHFLPGNEGLPAGQGEDIDLMQRMVCRPDSHVARAMVAAAIAARHQPYGLHRLGITMHVYADTWAHQGFAGVNHEVNLVRNVRDDAGNLDTSLRNRLKSFFDDVFDSATSNFVGKTMPLGHGAALSYPDRPYLHWRYEDGLGSAVERDNPSDFLTAAERMCEAMQRFRIGDPSAAVPGLPAADRERIGRLLAETRLEEGEDRHAVWLDHIRGGHFAFGAAQPRYVDKGRGSWKFLAIGDHKRRDYSTERFDYRPSFLHSDWKMFHDALLAHRFEVIHEILPRFGICAA